MKGQGATAASSLRSIVTIGSRMVLSSNGLLASGGGGRGKRQSPRAPASQPLLPPESMETRTLRKRWRKLGRSHAAFASRAWSNSCDHA